jgi:hypothetical protein
MENNIYIIKGHENNGNTIITLVSKARLIENIEHHEMCNITIVSITRFIDYPWQAQNYFINRAKKDCSSFRLDAETMGLNDLVDCYIKD